MGYLKNNLFRSTQPLLNVVYFLFLLINLKRTQRIKTKSKRLNCIDINVIYSRI